MNRYERWYKYAIRVEYALSIYIIGRWKGLISNTTDERAVSAEIMERISAASAAEMV